MKNLVAMPLCAALITTALISCSTSHAPEPPATLRWDLPNTSEGLVDVSPDLNVVLESGAMQGACDRYRAGATDRHTMLLCGKWMFFYEGFGTGGVPAAMMTGLMKYFPDQVGPGFSKMGMIEDPTSADHLPIGYGATIPYAGTSPSAAKIPALAFTCASCHFGRLPDGRYAVGAPNHDYEYGKQNLAFMVLTPLLLGADPTQHDPAAVAAVKPMLDHANANPSAVRDAYIASLSDLFALPAAPPFGVATEHAYATWKSGTLDALAAPSIYDDGVNGITKIPAIWSMPDDAEIHASGMTHAMIGWSGSSPSVLAFARGFIALGEAKPEDWSDERLRPFVEYVLSLRAPKPAHAPEAALVQRGGSLFAEKGCVGCHGGPRGSGLRVYRFEEIGTDDAIERMLDPQLTGQPCCKFPFPEGQKLTHGVKSPRLAGLWAMKRYLHNGSVDSLEDLFCMNGPRGKILEPSYRDTGHDFTCSGLLPDEKTALIAYLSAH